MAQKYRFYYLHQYSISYFSFIRNKKKFLPHIAALSPSSVIEIFSFYLPSLIFTDVMSVFRQIS